MIQFFLTLIVYVCKEVEYENETIKKSLFLFLPSIFLSSVDGGMLCCCLPELSVLWDLVDSSTFHFLYISARGQGSLMVLAKFSIHYGMSNFKVGLGLQVSF